MADGKGGNDWSSIWNTTGSCLAEWNGLMAGVNVGDWELLQTLTDFELSGFDVTASDLWTSVSNGRKVSGTRVVLLLLVAVVVFTFGRRRFTWATILRTRVEVPEKLKWRPSWLSNCLLTRPSWRKKSLLSIKWIERLLFVIVWRHSLTYFALLFKFCRRDGDVLWLRVLFPLGKMLDISMTHLEKKCMLC